MKNLIESIESQLKNKNQIDNFNPKTNFKRFTWDITLNLFFSVKFNSFQIQDDDFIEKYAFNLIRFILICFFCCFLS